MISPVKMVSIEGLVNFREGPFSDIKTYGIAQRRIICQQLLRQMLRHPEQNAADIIIVSEQLKALQ